MKISCIINNYNYCKYLGDAIESALFQTRPFDEIVIVDDGSTDGSRDVLSGYQSNPRVKIILKDNAGQLSAFNAGFEVSSGDWICFLDSDDRYKPDFLEKMEKTALEKEKVDFLFCKREYINENGESIPVRYRDRYARDIDYGYTIAKTYYAFSYTGQPTSLNMIKRNVLERILPFDMLEEFRVCADIVLIQGASLVGARKYLMDKRLVEYRVHGENAYHGIRRGADVLFMEKLSKLRMMDIFVDRCIKMDRRRLKELIAEEYKTKPARHAREMMIYIYVTLVSELHFFRKIETLLKILKSHLKKNGKMQSCVTETIERL